jgi:hypothetical protein
MGGQTDWLGKSSSFSARQAWNTAGPGRPIHAQEVCWEGPDKLDADRVRKGTWGVALGGGIPNYAEQFDGVQGNGKAFPYVKVLLDFIESVPTIACGRATSW